MRFTPRLTSTVLGTLALAGVVSAQHSRFSDPSSNELLKDYFFQELVDGSILAADALGTYNFANFAEYAASNFFEQHGLRCASDRLPQIFALGTSADCNSSNTTVKAEYDPSTGTITIPVWFHVLMNKRGTAGVVTDARITQQVAVLNSTFASSGVQFSHAGTTRSQNNTWYNDGGTYYNTLARDVHNNLNIYTNLASGNLGYAYVPSGGGVVGNKWDRVVIYHSTIGNPAPYGAPYHLGLTTVHEVGHYLGLYHTFQGGCASASGCSNNGDLICDTNPESTPNFSPCSRNSACGAWLDPTTNFMDYSDDVCMTGFSSNQQNRMRCTIANIRTRIPNTIP